MKAYQQMAASWRHGACSLRREVSAWYFGTITIALAVLRGGWRLRPRSSMILGNAFAPGNAARRIKRACRQPIDRRALFQFSRRAQYSERNRNKHLILMSSALRFMKSLGTVVL